jgi:hypothetical protein
MRTEAEIHMRTSPDATARTASPGRRIGRHRRIAVWSLAVASACTFGGAEVAGPSRSPVSIPQPAVQGLDVAPSSERVDLTMPTFSDPTKITNPLFPVSRQRSVLFLGHVDGKPFRTEVTLLPFTRIVEWRGQRIEALVSQYMAYLDGRIQEVAYDLYAQADDGSVWYLGEDVSDFRDGAIVTKEGTWLAGKDAPAAMIMPGHPAVGDVYRTENSPGFAFEEVTVTAVDRTLEGPIDPIQGGLVAQELHMDGKTEDKQFAPGYGEFYTADGPDVEALALAVPTDSSTQRPPQPGSMETAALDAADAADRADWRAASASVDDLSHAWASVDAGFAPRLVVPKMTAAIRILSKAVRDRDTARSRQAGIDVAQMSLDLELRDSPVTTVDLARMDLWTRQLMLDADAGDGADVSGDVFTLSYIRDRILGAVDATDLTTVNTLVQHLQVAAADGDLARADANAVDLHDALNRIIAS